MSRVWPATCLVVLLVVGGPWAVQVPAGATPGDGGAELVAVVPNPTAYGDAGEYLVIEFAAPTDGSRWSIDDGETVAALPNRTLSGRVLATTDPEAVPEVPPNVTVVALEGRLALANAGETVELRYDGLVVDRVTYEDAPEGDRYVKTDTGWHWRTPGRTDFPVTAARNVPARLFVLPDAPGVPLATIESADERLLLAAYTFTSDRVARRLCAARDRGVRVEVLLEGSPVGGMPRRQARMLDRLAACDVRLHVLGGPGDRYGVHHAKYAVVDDRAMVLSENWKPAGVGGRSSRGWGAVLDSPAIAAALAETFAADAGFRDVRPWSEARADVNLVDAPVANGSYPTRFQPLDVEVDRVDVLVAPDNAEAGIVDLLDTADGSIAIQQVSIGSSDHPFVTASRRAAARGVAVDVLLAGAWYVRADNRELVEELNRLGREDGIPLRARLVRPRSRYEKVHVKGVVVDGEAAVVGSLNWNRHATRSNREVVVVLHDPEAGAYYGRVFRADWRGGTWRLPIGYGMSVVLAGVGSAALVRRSVQFDETAPSAVPYHPSSRHPDGPIEPPTESAPDRR